MTFSNEITHRNLDSIPQCVLDTFKEIGLSPNIAGYLYLSTAIPLIAREPGVMGYKMTGANGVYNIVANHWETTSHRVERAIRHAIETVWDRGDYEALNKLFGNCVNPLKGKPTNSEFLTTLAFALRKQILEEDRDS